MKNIALLLALAVLSAPLWAQEVRFPVRTSLAALGGGHMPEVDAVKDAGTVDKTRRISCTMDVDFRIRASGFIFFKVWALYRGKATVRCDGGKAVAYDLAGEGPSLGLQIPSQGDALNSVASGKAYGLNLRLPVDFTPEKLEGVYLGAGVSTVLGGVSISPFTNENANLGVELRLPTGLGERGGNLVSVDLQRLRMTLRRK